MQNKEYDCAKFPRCNDRSSKMYLPSRDFEKSAYKKNKANRANASPSSTNGRCEIRSYFKHVLSYVIIPTSYFVTIATSRSYYFNELLQNAD